MTIEWFTDENTFTPFLARVFALVLPFVIPWVGHTRDGYWLRVPVGVRISQPVQNLYPWCGYLQLHAAILDSFPQHPPSRRHRFSRDFPHPIIQPSSMHNIYINSNEVMVTTHLHLTKSRHSHVYTTALETPHHASQVGSPSPVTNAWLLDFLLQVPNAGCYQKQFCVYGFS
ncbi:hypothetical protein EDB83DRAFT_2315212 [Lactarius deliciosus]|nr:hypothetical protein EDB83DRAFT_2315212 [Lactarius deliciosus]